LASSLGLRATASVEAEELGWWDSPARAVESDGGMRANNFKFWLKDEHKVDLSNADIRESPLEGLGVFVDKDLSKGDVLFEVPKSACIYPELVFNDRQLGKTMKQLAKQAGDGIEVIALATYLSREKMMGTQSTYQPYIEILPWDTSLHPLLWTVPEVELLQGTYAYDQVQEFRDQVEAATELFEPVLNPKGWKAVFQPIESERVRRQVRNLLAHSVMFRRKLLRNFADEHRGVRFHDARSLRVGALPRVRFRHRGGR